MDLKEYVLIAKVGKAHGLKGEIRIYPYAALPEGFNSCRSVILQDDKGNLGTHTVNSFRPHGKFIVAVFAGVRDRDQADALTGSQLWVHRSDLPKAKRGEHFWYEYIGLAVYTDQGVALGSVTDILQTGAHDILIVSGNGREYMIPLIREVVTEMDPDAGRLLISPLPGLLEINE